MELVPACLATSFVRMDQLEALDPAPEESLLDLPAAECSAYGCMRTLFQTGGYRVPKQSRLVNRWSHSIRQYITLTCKKDVSADVGPLTAFGAPRRAIAKGNLW